VENWDESARTIGLQFTVVSDVFWELLRFPTKLHQPRVLRSTVGTHSTFFQTSSTTSPLPRAALMNHLSPSIVMAKVKSFPRRCL